MLWPSGELVGVCFSSGCRVFGKFEPRKLDDLKSGASALIGRQGIFEALWIIESDEPYGGE